MGPWRPSRASACRLSRVAGAADLKAVERQLVSQREIRVLLAVQDQHGPVCDGHASMLVKRGRGPDHLPAQGHPRSDGLDGRCAHFGLLSRTEERTQTSTTDPADSYGRSSASKVVTSVLTGRAGCRKHPVRPLDMSIAADE